MKGFHKILLLLFSVIGLAFCVGMMSLLYDVPFTMDMAYSFITFYPWLDTFFAGFAAFMCLCFFLLFVAALFVPHKTNDLVIVKDKGRLMFSKQAVESTIRCSFEDVKGINIAKVKAKLNRKPEKTKVYIKMSVNNVNGLAGLAETVQNRIEAALISSLGFSTKSIHIKVVEFNNDGKAPEKANEEAAEKPGETVAEKIDEITAEKTGETAAEKTDETVAENPDEITAEKTEEVTAISRVE